MVTVVISQRDGQESNSRSLSHKTDLINQKSVYSSRNTIDTNRTPRKDATPLTGARKNNIKRNNK